MDPRERADAALARARARGAFVVTPEDAVSPMDAASTVQIPRAVMNALDPHQQTADTTMVLPAADGRNRPNPPNPPAQPGRFPTPAPPNQASSHPTGPPRPQPAEQQPPPPRPWNGPHQPVIERGSLSRRLDGTD